MVFRLQFDPKAAAVLTGMERGGRDPQLLKKVRSCLGRLQENPRHPGLRTHRYHVLRGPDGQDVWEAYVENRTPSAWRVWFWYGPEPDVITILLIGPHP